MKNYEQGDEIILIGFSRGAFTARSIGGLINAVGLLTRNGLESFYCVFKDWENQMNPSYKATYGTPSWPTTRPKFWDPSYVPQLEKAGLTRPKIPVKAIGIWDTCGSLGIPEMTIFGFIKLFSQERTEYSFINTEVPSNVENAYQALALDERRKPFDCTLWESPKPGASTNLRTLKQTWFPGVHSGVGGGYPDTSIADVTLAWMITQLSEHLTFDEDYMLCQQEQNVQYYKVNKQPVAPWASGLIFRNDTGISNTLTGRIVRTPGEIVRTPGEYYVVDPRTGKPTKTRLTDTCEFIHPAVRYRIESKGPGIAESQSTTAKDNYDPMALKGWTYIPPNEPWRDDKALGIGPQAQEWDGYGKWMVKREDGSVTYIVEEKIEAKTDEMSLLRAWPGVSSKVLT